MSRTLVVGIETSGDLGSVGIYAPGSADAPSLALEEVFGEGLIHGVALAPTVEKVLREAGATIRDVTLIAVGLGPGSYTGVRVGVAFAKSLAHAAGIPVVGVSSLLAMAAAAPAGRTVLCARDARRESLYVAAYRTGPMPPEEVRPVSLLPRDELPGSLPSDTLVIGDALARYPDLLSGEGRVAGERSLWRSPALAVARLGEIEHRDRGPDSTHDLAPVYLRASEAEERLGKAGGAE